MFQYSKRLDSRRGFTVPEVLVAAVVLGAALTVSVQMLSAVAASDREAARRTTALAEAGNTLEQLTSTSWEKLTPELAAATELSPSAASQLPGGASKVNIEELDTQPPAKRMSVEVRWQGRQGRPVAPVRLTAWVHRAAGGQP